MSSILAKLSTPEGISSILFLIGIALMVSGVYVLAGIGWALLACSLPFLLISIILFRGVLNG